MSTRPYEGTPGRDSVHANERSRQPMSVWELIQSDWARYTFDGSATPKRLRALISQGMWACFVYRLGHETTRPGPWRLFYPLAVVAYKCVEILTGISLLPHTKIGKGFYISHFGQIVIAGNVEIGDNCNIGQGVTLGLGRKGGVWGSPRLGNRVFIGANAVVYGPITVADDAAIGPNCVVADDVPARAVLKVPDPIVAGTQGSFAWVRYRDAEDDIERQRSLEISNAERAARRADPNDSK